MEIIDIAVAESRLDALVERAMAGERICLARNGEPVIELVPVRAETGQRRFGALRGELKVPQEFFDLLPDDELPAGMETRWADGMEFTKEQEALLTTSSRQHGNAFVPSSSAAIDLPSATLPLSTTTSPTPSPTTDSADARHLERGLGLSDASMLVIGSMIGSGDLPAATGWCWKRRVWRLGHGVDAADGAESFLFLRR
ncbi:MAG TPA: hypothetical protein VGB15_23185 [Longimicrobium sp.]